VIRVRGARAQNLRDVSIDIPKHQLTVFSGISGFGKSSLVLDEPRPGLHPADVEQLLALLDRLVDDGTSIVVIEHNRPVVAHADWVIDLGPGAGHGAGSAVFEGTPAALAEAAATPTGKHLAAALA
jgi:excinuclease UvrABC ATPase subunit